MLQCPIVNYALVCEYSSTALDLKIKNGNLHTALSVSNNNIFVCVWRSKQSTQNKEHVTADLNQAHTSQDPSLVSQTLKLTSWNCRGLSTGEPYIYQLAEDGSDVIIVTEHWLWPYEANRLSKVHSTFAAVCTTDSRLHECSNLTMGCGGVGIMYRRGLNVSALLNISSDRICGIRIHLISSEPSYITVLGVYLLCADLGMDAYCEALLELE